jgi:hypothetical protein
MKFQGGCLCGQARYSADDAPLSPAIAIAAIAAAQAARRIVHT